MIRFKGSKKFLGDLMKLRYVFGLLLILGMAFAATSNIKSALNELQDTTKNMMGVTALLGLGVGIVFLAIALGIHFLVKGVQGILKIGMFICGVIGILALLGGIISVVIFLLTPSLIGGMTGN